MQDRYVADVGDFGKYGLLNFIASKTKLRLGVNWCLTSPSPKENNRDGKFIDYLEKDTKRLKECDEKLYEKLQKIIKDWKDRGKNPEDRCVMKIEEGKILPERTIFFSNDINNRKEWLDNSIHSLSESELIFFDPDNGIAYNGIYVKNEDKSPKHVYFNEIKNYFEKGQSLVIYQHGGDRTAKFDTILEIKKEKLIKELEKINENQIIFMRYHRGTARAFYIVMQQKHSVCITKAIDDFLETKWGKHKHFTKI